MAELVQFVAPTSARDEVCEQLRAVLEEAERGEVLSVAIAWVRRAPETEPELRARYTGERSFGFLVAAVQMLSFDLQWQAVASRHGLAEG